MGKAGSALGKLSSIAKSQGLLYAKRVGKVIKKFTEQEQVAVAAEGLLFPIVEQAYECMDDAQKVGKRAANATLATTEKVVNATTKIIRPFFHAVLSESELASLQQKFKSRIRYKDVVLDFCYEHIFNGEIGKNDKLGGLHHDYQGMLQKAGFLKLVDVKKLSNGYYEALIWCNAKKKLIRKTFFPDHYTREQVIEQTCNALNNVIEAEQQGNRLVLKGSTSDNAILKIILESTSNIVTVYPFID